MIRRATVLFLVYIYTWRCAALHLIVFIIFRGIVLLVIVVVLLFSYPGVLFL